MKVLTIIALLFVIVVMTLVGYTVTKEEETKHIVDTIYIERYTSSVDTIFIHPCNRECADRLKETQRIQKIIDYEIVGRKKNPTMITPEDLHLILTLLNNK